MALGPLLLLGSLGLGLLPGSISERPGEGAAEAGGGKGGRGGPGGWARPGGGEAALPQATAGERQAAFVRGLRLLLFFQGPCVPGKNRKANPRTVQPAPGAAAAEGRPEPPSPRRPAPAGCRPFVCGASGKSEVAPAVTEHNRNSARFH